MQNLAWGLTMTALGMGLVFGLLALLWGLLTLALRLDAPPAAVAGGVGPPDAETAGPAEASGELAPDLVAAIGIAVLTHKAVRRRQAAPEMRSYWPGSLLYASRWVGIGRSRQTRNWRKVR